MTAVITADQPGEAEPPGPQPPGINQWRERIDQIDATMIALWRERASLSQQVGAARIAAGGTRLALSREREILDRFHRELGQLGTELALLVLRAGRGSLSRPA